MSELLEETRANTEYIRSKGYRVVEMWECDWRQMKRTNQELQRFIATEVRRTLDTIKIMSRGLILSEVRNGRLFGLSGDADPRKAIIADTMKLVGNSGYGKTIANQLKHMNVEYCSDAEASRKVNTH
ncbi:unnamed protein product, partial [Porites evermanni]